MTRKPDDNHGEGDPEAAKRFNEAETGFVNSARGKRTIRKGARVKPEEEEEALQDAERRGRERSKGESEESADE